MSNTKHRIGWCVNCGFVHENVRAYTMVEDGVTVIKPICDKCRKEERQRSRMVYCTLCGLVKGENLFPTTVERLQFNTNSTCNFVIPLCRECKNRPHSEIRQLLNKEIREICTTCQDRFKCYTTQHEEPRDSKVFSQDPQKMQRNTRTTKRFWR